MGEIKNDHKPRTTEHKERGAHLLPISIQMSDRVVKKKNKWRTGNTKASREMDEWLMVEMRQ